MSRLQTDDLAKVVDVVVCSCYVLFAFYVKNRDTKIFCLNFPLKKSITYLICDKSVYFLHVSRILITQ